MILPLHDTVFLVVKVKIPDPYNPKGGTTVEQVATTPTRCTIWPATATEDVENGTRILTDTRYKALFPPATALSAKGAVQWRGVVYDVLGEPLVSSLRGRPHHLEVLLSRRA